MKGSVEEHDSTLPGTQVEAPGGPGVNPTWTSSAKAAVGTAVSQQSRVWFTIGEGILNEVYFPDVDKANTRRIGFLVTDGRDFFSDEEVGTTHETQWIEEGIPTFRVISTCKQGHYRITKEISAQSFRDTLILKCSFDVLDGSALKLFLNIEPHMSDQGAGNTGWIASYKGLSMLAACRINRTLAAYASVPFAETTVGFVGVNDGYQQLKKHRRLTDRYNVANQGNVSLCAELDLRDSPEFLVAIAFGSDAAEAAQQARAGILFGFEQSQERFLCDWRNAQAAMRNLSTPEGSAHDMYRISTAMLKTHESKRFPGGFVASLSMPWGFARGDEDTGAYHVLWPRDLCETAMGLTACDDPDSGRRALMYLACTQEADGSWSQNMWLDGIRHWSAIQMDGIAMPILLADQLRRSNNLDKHDPWPMIRQAVAFLLKMGPTSQQDRWEALAGYTPFTMACEIAALLAAADFADAAAEHDEANFLRVTADAWNAAVDDYLYATGTDLARKHGVDGYYLRITPDAIIQNPDLNSLSIHLENHVGNAGVHKVVDVVSPDALALTRFGLRAADDPRMVATAKVIDMELKRDLATGPGWIRSTDDGYGEHADGSPYDGAGIGRCWPLLAGERGHFELASGNRDAAVDLLRVISRQTSACGMIPEQVWDAEDIPEHKLFNGHPSGSGMPLSWAHGEYVKLLRSCTEGEVWDCPPQTVERYQKQQTVAAYEIWTEHAPRTWVTAGKHLRMDFDDSSTVRWSVDGGVEQNGTTVRAILGRHSLVLTLPLEWTKLDVTVEREKPEQLSLFCHRKNVTVAS